MKTVVLGVLIILVSCIALVSIDPANSATHEQPKPKWKPVIVKKKYVENTVTKDLIFGTGNWHSTDRYIIDKTGKMWVNISKQDFILCEVGDTLWTKDGWSLQINKK